MVTSDIIFVSKWWFAFFVIGLIFLPLTTRIFSNFVDKGYIFAKVIGMALISYAVFVFGILKIAPFTEATIYLIILFFLILDIFLMTRDHSKTSLFRHSGKPRPCGAHPESEILKQVQNDKRDSGQARMTGFNWKIFIFEEILFILTLFFWSFIRAHEPSIHGLEKYMDFGFVNSILRSTYFPPTDMWFPPFSINYYYFGHLVTAVLTKLSNIPSSVTYNLMLSTLFALTFTASFSIGANFLYNLKTTTQSLKLLLGGLLTACIVSLSGNLHTIYAFFKPYANENPVPFWQLAFSPNTFPNGYWYPNATRFIENTIHEFPIYSAVVSDLHGHYLDVPFVLLIIAVLLSLINSKHEAMYRTVPDEARSTKQRDSGVANAPQNDVVLASKRSLRVQNLFRISNFEFRILLISFLLAIMFMTNAWDGLIYFLLAALVILYLILNPFNSSHVPKEIKNEKLKMKNSFQIESFKLKVFSWLLHLSIIVITFVLFSLPFNLFFKPFASGIGILCGPEFLTNIEKIGPFLLEKDHCQRSPWWQLLILYGFFYFWVTSFIVFIYKKVGESQNSKLKNYSFILNLFQYLLAKIPKQVRNDNSWNFGILTKSDLFVLILIVISTILIIIPEFIYVKDIYPGHYRANTMFKLVYQAFIMLSLASGYIIIRLFLNLKSLIINRNLSYWKLGYWVIGIIGLSLVSLYPYFAINAYYDNLKTYKGLDGTTYLKTLYPTDYSAILWINKNIKGQPIILEAQGDSYTDYARVSSNTGLPTVLGWTVHEWLWRGTYDIPSPRIEEVQKVYESEDLEETKKLLKKYKVSLVFFGDLERQKYPNLNEEKFKKFGKVVYKNGETRIYKID